MATNNDDDEKVTPRLIEEIYTELAEADTRLRMAHGIHRKLCGRWHAYVPLQIIYNRVLDVLWSRPSQDAFEAAVAATSLVPFLIAVPSKSSNLPPVIIRPGDRKPGNKRTHVDFVRCLRSEGCGETARKPTPIFHKYLRHLKRIRAICRASKPRMQDRDAFEVFEFELARLIKLEKFATPAVEIQAELALIAAEKTFENYATIKGLYEMDRESLVKEQMGLCIRPKRLVCHMKKIYTRK